MKLEPDDVLPARVESHPAGVRGLKHRTRFCKCSHFRVAPRRGAWIETVLVVDLILPHFVAPRRGAWIETIMASMTGSIFSRRTPQGCVD